MAVRTFAAARVICERANWQVTNLALQKILYLAHMVHMGRTGARMIAPSFEAWDYGPVVPKLYKRVRYFGDKPIQDVFAAERSIAGSLEAATINEACDTLLRKTPGQLVAMTHWENGAWARNYRPGVRGIVIPDGDIIDEYNARTRPRVAA